MDEILLDGPLAQSRGVIARYPSPEERYVFDFASTKPRLIHMIGVRRPLLVRWLVDGEVVARETLAPWTGWGRHRADTVTEERP